LKLLEYVGVAEIEQCSVQKGCSETSTESNEERAAESDERRKRTEAQSDVTVEDNNALDSQLAAEEVKKKAKLAHLAAFPNSYQVI
jgi:hypothetical protein